MCSQSVSLSACNENVIFFLTKDAPICCWIFSPSVVLNMGTQITTRNSYHLTMRNHYPRVDTFKEINAVDVIIVYHWRPVGKTERTVKRTWHLTANGEPLTKAGIWLEAPDTDGLFSYISVQWGTSKSILPIRLFCKYSNTSLNITLKATHPRNCAPS